MDSTVEEVLEFVQENGVKFIKLLFCDIFGVQKSISIMSDELQAAFEHGVSIDANAVQGFQDATHSDLFIVPEAATLSVLPWRPGPGRVIRFFCAIQNPDGSPYELDGRHLLKRVVSAYEKKGYVCKVGAECEFYLFKTDERGNPQYEPFDRAGYLDIEPLDKGSDIRREICLTLEEMGIMPESSHHEQGPGQNEIDFKFGNALESADNLMAFKAATRSIAARNGLHASFMPKPLRGVAGSGLHVNISLVESGHNVFKDAFKDERTDVAKSFMAGVLDKAAEITAFLNPLSNSYERFGEFEAPYYVSWSQQNRSQLIRVPAPREGRSRMELRSPDPASNPYVGFALILAAGLQGIEEKMTLPQPRNEDMYEVAASELDPLGALPLTLGEALKLARGSEFIKEVIGEKYWDRYLTRKEQEWLTYKTYSNKDEYYQEHDFPFI